MCFQELHEAFHAYALGVGEDDIYIGTVAGSIHIFSCTSLEWRGEVAYQHSLRSELGLTSGDNESASLNTNGNALGWPVTSIQVRSKVVVVCGVLFW